MKLSSDRPGFNNGRFTNHMPQSYYRGNVAISKSIFSEKKVDVMIAMEFVFRDMERLRTGRNVGCYDLSIEVTNLAEWEFIKLEVRNLCRMFPKADPAFEYSRQKFTFNVPGDNYRLWVRVGDDGYVGINVVWTHPDVARQSKINENKKMAAVAYS
jgi:hypothetical protein